MLDFAYVPSPNSYPDRLRPLRLIVMHTMESGEDTDTAENVAVYFAQPSTRASAHVCIDSDSGVECVKPEGTAWAAPGANADGYQIEQAGRAGQGAAGWADDYSQKVLRLAAKVAAVICRDYSIPVRHLIVAEVADGATPGFCGHIDVTNAFPTLGDHTDPGPDFPWPLFLRLVTDALGPTPTPTPTLDEEDEMIVQGQRLHDANDKPLNTYVFAEHGGLPNGTREFSHAYVNVSSPRGTASVRVSRKSRDGKAEFFGASATVAPDGSVGFDTFTDPRLEVPCLTRVDFTGVDDIACSMRLVK